MQLGCKEEVLLPDFQLYSLDFSSPILANNYLSDTNVYAHIHFVFPGDSKCVFKFERHCEKLVLPEFNRYSEHLGSFKMDTLVHCA
jgi:hypothetical protein